MGMRECTIKWKNYKENMFTPNKNKKTDGSKEWGPSSI